MLTKWLEKNNLDEADLDELVHDAAAALASNANNEGITGQIAFLKGIAGWSDDDILNALRV